MDRERLTITLQKTILAKVDALIDKTKIRNRSHAIEYLITQNLTPKISQAVIQLSRLKYGRPRELVEAEISQRARL